MMQELEDKLKTADGIKGIVLKLMAENREMKEHFANAIYINRVNITNIKNGEHNTFSLPSDCTRYISKNAKVLDRNGPNNEPLNLKVDPLIGQEI